MPTSCAKSLSYTDSGLTEELDLVTGRIQSSIDEATVRMSDALRHGQRHYHLDTERGGQQPRLAAVSYPGEQLQGTLTQVTNDARSTLAERTQEIGKQVNMVGQAVATLLETRTAGLRETGETVTREIEMALGARAIELLRAST